jgi:hypothetical protein
MHKSQGELLKELKDAYTKVKVDGLYSHYKNPQKIYKVLTLAVTEADDSISVIYEAQYGDKLVFVRPLISWLDRVKLANIYTERFTFIK